MNIGFIGLGNMGTGMASNLPKYSQKRDHKLIVFDLNRDVVKRFLSMAAKTVDRAGQLASEVEIGFTSLTSDKDVNLIALGDNGLLGNLPDGEVWFETSTNEVEQWKIIRAESKKTLTLIDAPVTGSHECAEAGSLTMLLGASLSDLNTLADSHQFHEVY